MRIYPFLFAAAVTLSAYGDASATRSSSTFERLSPPHQHEPQRFLRDEAEANEEERISFSDFMTAFNQARTPELGEATFPNKASNFIRNTIGRGQSLNFDMADDKLLENAKFYSWVKTIIKKRNKADDLEVVLATRLAAYYNDDRLLEILEKASSDKPATKVFATYLQDGWIKAKVKAAGSIDEKLDNMFKLINIDDDNVLSTPPFKAWAELMKQKHSATAEAEMAKALSYRYRYGDGDGDGDGDDRFLEMLERFSKKEETKDSATKELAIHLQDEWIKAKVEAEESTDKVRMHVLELINIDDDNVLSSSRFKAWAGLMKKQYENPEELKNMMALNLAGVHSYELFWKMLEKPTDDEATKLIVTELQEGFMNWHLNDKWSAHTMFKECYLLADKKKVNFDTMLSNPRFKMWVEYVKKQHKKDKEDKEETAWKDMAHSMAREYDKNHLLKMLRRSSAETEDVAKSLVPEMEKLLLIHKQNKKRHVSRMKFSQTDHEL